MDIKFTILNSADVVPTLEKDRIAQFFKTYIEHTDDSKETVLSAVEYAISPYPHQGGFILLAELPHESAPVAGVIVNKTYMEGFFPENILVYAAVDHQKCPQGVIEKMMKKVSSVAKGNISVHLGLEFSHKAGVFEAMGFKTTGTQMRMV